MLCLHWSRTCISGVQCSGGSVWGQWQARYSMDFLETFKIVDLPSKSPMLKLLTIFCLKNTEKIGLQNPITDLPLKLDEQPVICSESCKRLFWYNKITIGCGSHQLLRLRIFKIL